MVKVISGHSAPESDMAVATAAIRAGRVGPTRFA